MKELKNLIGDIWDEVNGAKHYAKKAIECKDHDQSRRNKYAEMAQQEMAHAESLKKFAAEMIESHPEHEMMKVIWDWEWERIADAMAETRGMLGMVK